MGGSERTNKGGKERSGMGQGGVGPFFLFLRVRHNSCRWFIQKAGRSRKNKEEE